MIKKNAIIITANRCPCEDAGGIRQHYTAKILKKLGFNVTVVGYGKWKKNNKRKYDGINYISYETKSGNRLCRLVNRLIFGIKVLFFINANIKKINIILVVDILPLSMKRISSIAKKNNIILIHDSVEWYSPEEFSNGKRNIEYILKNILNTRIIDHNWKVMAISSYLKNYFEYKAKAVVQIPVIMNTNIKLPNRSEINSEKIIFSYVGGPGRKDYLKELIIGFSYLTDEEKNRIEIHLVGITDKQLESVCGIDNTIMSKMKNMIFAHGRLPHDEAIKWVINSDYSMLLRDETLRYARAGFPTKVVESLMCGTPPFCNISSDLGEYLVDGHNSIIIGGHSSNDVLIAIRKSLSISKEDYNIMRINAKRTAENHFYYLKYEDKMRVLLNND